MARASLEAGGDAKPKATQPTNRPTNKQTSNSTNPTQHDWQALEGVLRSELVRANVLLWGGGAMVPREVIPEVRFAS